MIQSLKIHDRHWRLTESSGPAYVCMDLLIGSERTLLIDTGYGFENPLPAIRQITKLPLSVAITHSHKDHIGGLCYFHCPVYIPEGDLPYFSPDTPSGNTVAFFKENTPIMVHEGDRIDLGNMAVSVIETPGHTPGCVSYYNNAENEIFLSDSVAPAVMLWQPLSQRLADLTHTVNKLRAVSLDTLWVGHDSRPIPGKNLDLYTQTIYDAQNAGNWLPLPGRDDAYIYPCASYKEAIYGSSVEDIYKNFIQRPDFSCVFIFDYPHIDP